MRNFVGAMLVLTVVGLPMGIAGASGTPAQKCAAAKIKAASKKLSRKLKCWQKAIGEGGIGLPTSICLDPVETKFNAAIAKIEGKGGCNFPGDKSMLEDIVEGAVTGLASLAPAQPATCCVLPDDGTDSSICAWTSSSSSCLELNGVPGAAGTLCDGPTGTCIAPPASLGSCCDIAFDPTGSGLSCIANINAGDCDSTYGGVIVSDAYCPPSGGGCVR